jgi:tetratricopeptide (TPR) repeat protein
MPVRIFLSAVSDEFRDYRDQLRHDLTRHNVEVKVQEDFKDLGTVTLDKLDVYITNCDAVVHLVGDMTGADAKPESTKSMLAKYPDLPDRLPPLRQPLADGLAISYTQWEAWLALYHGKLLVIAKADDAAPRGPIYAPTDDARAAQQKHLARLSAVERYPGETFTGPDNLAKLILSGAILELLATADNRRIKIRTAVVAVVALLVMLVGYLAWDRHVRNVESAATAKKSEEMAALAKKNETTNETILALTRQLVVASQTQAAPGREQAVGAAVTNIATSAAAGDTRLQQALDLLKAGNIEDASKLLRAVADEKAAAMAQAQARIREDSEQAATAWRNLGAIAGLRDPKSAREAYARAVMLDPEDTESLFWDGWLELEAGNLAAAERSYRQLLTLKQAEPDSRDAYWARLGLGDIEYARGRLSPALAGYRAAQASAEGMAKSNPGNAGWQRDVSASYDRIGDVLVAQGNLPEARKSFRDGLAIRDRLAKADPGNADWQNDLSASYDRVGDVLLAQGNLPEALKSFRDGLAIRDRLAKADPGNAGWQRDLSVSYEKVGGVLVAQGNLPEALKSFRDALAITDRLANSDPGNAGWQRDLSVSYEKIGKVLMAQGNLPEALKSFRDEFAITDRLANSDPGNAGWQRDLSVSCNNIGDALVARGNLPEALKSFRDGLAIIGRLAKADPGNAGWQRDLSVSYSKLADVFRKAGDNAMALDALRQGRAIMLQMTSLSPDNAAWKRDLALFDGQIAELAR